MLHTKTHTPIHTSLINKTLHKSELYKRGREKERDSKLLAWLSMATVFWRQIISNVQSALLLSMVGYHHALQHMMMFCQPYA